ncbi:MAG: Transcriptional regulator, CopG family [Rhizobium sp.]|nr:Transcriptional regulator, CopG family [Rhizobium sp.]
MAVSVKLDDDLKARVRQLAEDQQRSPRWIMREAIKQYVAKEEARSSFAKEAMAAWIDYKETGLHITGEELDEWLRTWGTVDETDVPECHV